MKQFNLLGVLALLVLILFLLSGCNSHSKFINTGDTKHDTGTYYIYRSYSAITGRIKTALVDQVWDVFQSGDTVFIAPGGFVMRDANIRGLSTDSIMKGYDAVVLGICAGTVTLVDDTEVIDRTLGVPKIRRDTSD